MQLSIALTTSNGQRNKKQLHMKRILIALVVAFAFCSLIVAQQKTTTSKDNSSVTVSSADTDADSTYEAEFTDTPDDSTYVADSQYSYPGDESDLNLLLEKFPQSAINGGIAIVAVTLGIIFAFPLFVIFIAFYFRYRSRRARYKLVEQALASGQPIPEGIFKETMNLDTRSKGIKNTCLGIGLFIFLWGLTGSFGLGTIGLLIMFTGIGQWLVARNQNSTDERK